MGVRRQPEGSPIFLNPGPSFKLAWDDTLFYIAITSEEDMALEELKKGTNNPKTATKKTKASNILSRQSQWGSFTSVIDTSEEERNLGNGTFKCMLMFVTLTFMFT